MVNEQKLNTEFCLPDVAALMKKTDIEINGHNIHPTINKVFFIFKTISFLLLNNFEII